MTDVQFIKHRLPADHGFTDNEIEEELAETYNLDNKFLALASLLERLASSDRYQSESIGNYSHSGPLLMERAAYWRGQANTPSTADDQIKFIKATGLDFMPTVLYFGTELG